MTKNFSYLVLLLTGIAVITFIWIVIPNEEQEVYATVLLDSLSGDKGSVIAISKPSTCSIESKPKNLNSELFEALKSANDKAKPVRLKSLEPFIPTVDSKELAKYQSAGAPIQSLIRDNRSLLFLSRVGFSKSGEEAVFCVRRTHVGYADNSYFVVKKVEGNWKVEAFHVVSVS